MMAQTADNAWRSRIVCDPAIRHGEPTIRGTRIAVATIVASLVDYPIDELLVQFPRLTRDDVEAAILFAAEACHSSIVH